MNCETLYTNLLSAKRNNFGEIPVIIRYIDNVNGYIPEEGYSKVYRFFKFEGGFRRDTRVHTMDFHFMILNTPNQYNKTPANVNKLIELVEPYANTIDRKLKIFTDKGRYCPLIKTVVTDNGFELQVYKHLRDGG